MHLYKFGQNPSIGSGGKSAEKRIRRRGWDPHQKQCVPTPKAWGDITATIDWFGRWVTFVFSENTAIHVFAFLFTNEPMEGDTPAYCKSFTHKHKYFVYLSSKREVHKK